MHRLLRGLAVAVVATAAGSAGAAAIFTAGTDGFYSTVQAAIDQAVTQGGDAEIEVEAGTYHEHLLVSSGWSSGTLDIVGGWNSGFSSRSADPAATVIDGDGNGRPMELDAGGGAVVVEDLTLTNGTADSAGGGLYLLPAGGVSITVDGCSITDNTSSSANAAEGGGVDGYLSGTSTFTLSNTVVSGNVAHSTGGTASGGGIELAVTDTAQATFSDCRFTDNTASTDASSQVTGGGLDGYVYEQARMVISDSLIRGNTLAGSGTCLAPGGSFGLGLFSSTPEGTLTARRNRWLDNTCTTASSAPQIDVSTSGSSAAVVGDSEVAGGNGGGAEAHAYDTSEVDLVNLTVAGNAGPGLYLTQQGSATLSLANSIVDLNSPDTSFVGTVTSATDLVGSDPHFEDAAGGDYGVLGDSPAVDQGTNSAPGIGVLDLNRCARVQNGTVDEGATEQAGIYCGGFELDRTFRWSKTMQ